MGQNILISSVPCSEYQQNIIITVTFDNEYITWTGRKNHYKIKDKKPEVGQCSAFLRSSMGSSSRPSLSSANLNSINLI